MSQLEDATEEVESAVGTQGEVVGETGRVDVSMNVITHPYTRGIPLVELDVDDFMAPVETAARTTLITSRAAALQMIEQESGAILFFGGAGDGQRPQPRPHARLDPGRFRRDRVADASRPRRDPRGRR
jgi:NAD(P)-dependent dehydrogenase (short-subunit alcohol dehydrogenase family)